MEITYLLEKNDDYKLLSLGKIRPFKLGGVSRDLFMASIDTPQGVRAVAETPNFFSIGFIGKTFAGDSANKYTIGVTEGGGARGFMNEYSTKLRNALYPLLIKRLKTFCEETPKHPALFEQMINDGEDAAEKYWSLIFPEDKDIAFLKVDGDALIVTKAGDGMYRSCDVKNHPRDQLPKQGFYKVRLSFRYVVINLGREEDESPISLSLLIDQMFFTPEGCKAPKTVVMNLESFFGATAPAEPDRPTPSTPEIIDLDALMGLNTPALPRAEVDDPPPKKAKKVKKQTDITTLIPKF